MGDEKVDVAVLKASLQSFKEKLHELYESQADFLRAWPTHVARLAALEEKVSGLEKKLTDYIEAQRFSWTTVIAVASLVFSIALLWWDIRKSP